jgi:hypothetical protein
MFTNDRMCLCNLDTRFTCLQSLPVQMWCDAPLVPPRTLLLLLLTPLVTSVPAILVPLPTPVAAPAVAAAAAVPVDSTSCPAA